MGKHKLSQVSRASKSLAEIFDSTENRPCCREDLEAGEGASPLSLPRSEIGTRSRFQVESALTDRMPLITTKEPNPCPSLGSSTEAMPRGPWLTVCLI